MSVIASDKDGFILNHQLFTQNIFNQIEDQDKNQQSYQLNSILFHINSPFKSNEKHFKNVCKTSEEILNVKSKFDNFVRNHQYYFEVEDGDVNEKDAKSFADKFYKEDSKRMEGFNGGNVSDYGIITTINNELFIIPSHCKFFCYDIKEISKHLKTEKYDFILMDPPWWNKYIRRKRKHNSNDGYKMLFNSDIADIPIHDLLDEDGLIGIWCTNSNSIIDFIINKMFMTWGLKFVAQWYWIKITTKGQPICPFSAPMKKQPFERIIFGCKTTSKKYEALEDCEKLFCSVPSAIHSHKPPVNEMLKDYLCANPRCLEIFARYLLPNWTSFGNEVLKLQHLKLYETVSSE